jgi:hypothetical protein
MRVLEPRDGIASFVTTFQPFNPLKILLDGIAELTDEQLKLFKEYKVKFEIRK